MTTKAVFNSAADESTHSIIASPGAEGLHVLFSVNNVQVTVENIEKVFDQRTWISNHSFSYTDFVCLVQDLGVSFADDVQGGRTQVDSEDEQGTLRAELVDTINARMEQHMIPPVQPSELPNAHERVVAEEILTFMDKDEAVELQSFLDTKYAEYRSSCPADVEVSETQRRARFAYDTFYTLCLEFYVQKSLTKGQLCHRLRENIFLPLIPVTSLGNIDQQKESQNLVRQMTERVLPYFNAKVWKRWSDLQKLCAYVKQPAESLFQEFIQGEYYTLMRQVLEEHKDLVAPTWQPLYTIEVHDANVLVQKERQDLLQRASVVDNENVIKILDAMWDAHLRKVPESMRGYLKEASKDAFLKEHYYSVLHDEVQKRLDEGNMLQRRMANPSIDPASGDGQKASVRSEREALLSVMEAADCAAVEEEINTEWLALREGIGETYSKEIPLHASDDFRVAQYYKLAFRLFGTRLARPVGRAGTHEYDRRGASGSAQGEQTHEVRTGTNGNNIEIGMASLVSSRIYNPVPVQAPTDGPLTCFCCKTLFEQYFHGNQWMYEGILIEHDSQARTVTRRDMSKSPKKRTASEASTETVALDLVLVDNTGPVTFTLWDDCVYEFLRLCSGLAVEGNHNVIVRLEHLRVAQIKKSDWHGAILTRMQLCHSVSASAISVATNISFPSIPSSPFLISEGYERPSNEVCVYEYLPIRSKLQAPFKATIAGMVSDVQELESSQSGQPKRFFSLVDDMGSWLQCFAVGRNALSQVLKEGKVVVVYYASGKCSFGSSEAMVLVGKDCVITPLGEKQVKVPKKLKIELE